MSLDLDIIVVWNEITDTEVNSQYMYRTLFRIIEKGVITMGNSVVTDVQFGHLFLVCIKYTALQEVTVGYSERYHPVVSTYRIILCFSYLLTQNRD